MTQVRIQRLSDLGVDKISEVAHFIVKQFFEMFGPISEDEQALTQLFMKSIVSEQCFVALDQNKVIGVVGVSTPVRGAFEISFKEVNDCLGLRDGLKFYFNIVKSGVTLKSNQIYINTLAVEEAYRRQGIATLLLEECMAKSCADEYLLDVVDVNTGAIKLYQSIGFHVIKRKKQHFKKQAGFSEWVYMSKKIK